MMIIDYDQIDEWERWIGKYILEIAPKDLTERIIKSEPQFFEDAAEVVFDLVSREKLIELLYDRLNNFRVRVYHGTRLSDSELEKIRVEGLQPLVLKDRKPNLVKIFSRYKKWHQVESQIDDVLYSLGARAMAGKREDNCIHVCFSRTGLIQGCNHYLTHGAEVDGHVVDSLFPNDNAALKLLKKGRKPYLISFLPTFGEAAQAANPFGTLVDKNLSLLNILIKAWSFRQYDPSFYPAKLKDCTAAMFHGGVEACKLERFEMLNDNDLRNK
jgi:hypothetical protein